MRLSVNLNTSTKVTWHNFDDLVRQRYWAWGDMTTVAVQEISFALF